MTEPSGASRVLIVEDDPGSVQLLVGIFGERYELIVATRAEDAVNLLEEPVDLVLLDLYLGGMGGLELLRQIRNRSDWQDTPVVCVTGSESVGDVESAFRAGATDYVVKPYNSVILRAKVATFLDLRHKTEQLKAASFTDPLTEVANRRQFDYQLDKEWRRMGREQRPLALMMVDLDHFKQINDRFGHQAGDDCLVRLATLLQTCVSRGGDLVARYGGDEFVLLLPGIDQPDVIALAERIRRQAKEIVVNGSSVARQCHTVTVSIGCAAAVPESALEPAFLLRAADQQLYLAKDEGGRNCVRPRC